MPDPRRSNGAARRRLIRRVRREETHCHLCGQPVDTRLPATLPASPEVDELRPVSLGGDPYDRTNCRLAHRWCNRQRSVKPYLTERARLTADPPLFNSDGTLAREGGRAERRRVTAVVSRVW